MKDNKLLKVLFSVIMILCMICVPAIAGVKEDISHDDAESNNDMSALAAYTRGVYIKEVFTSPAWINGEGGYNYFTNGEKISTYMDSQFLHLYVSPEKVIEFNQKVSNYGQVQSGWIIKITYFIDSDRPTNIWYSENGGSMKSQFHQKGTHTKTFYIPIAENPSDRYSFSFNGFIPCDNGVNVGFWSGVYYNSPIIN